MKKNLILAAVLLVAPTIAAQSRGVTEAQLRGLARHYTAEQLYDILGIPVCASDPPVGACTTTHVCVDDTNDIFYVCIATGWTAVGDGGGAGSGDVTAVGDCIAADCFTDAGAGSTLSFEGTTTDANETHLTPDDPTAGTGTFRLPNLGGATKYLVADTTTVGEVDGSGLTVSGGMLIVDETSTDFDATIWGSSGAPTLWRLDGDNSTLEIGELEGGGGGPNALTAVQHVTASTDTTAIFGRSNNEQTNAAASHVATGVHGQSNWNPDAGASRGWSIGVLGIASIGASGITSTNDEVRGLGGTVLALGTPTGNTLNILQGARFSIQLQAGTTNQYNNLYGTKTVVTMGGTSNTATNVFGHYLGPVNNAGAGNVWTNLYGLYISDLTNLANTPTILDAIHFEAMDGAAKGATRGNVRFAGGGFDTGHLQLDDGHIFYDGTTFYAKQDAEPTTAQDGISFADHDLDSFSPLLNKTIDAGVATTTHAAGADFLQTLRHATDCTAITDGKAGEICYELDADALFVCEPTAGDCDTAGEWRSAGGGTEINALVADGVSGINDDQLAIGVSPGQVNYRTLVTGATSYSISTGTFGQAALADLSDVDGTTGTGSTVVLDTSPTIVTPTIASHANAGHDHTAGAGGGNIALGSATTGDYVDGITASQGLLKTGTEGADLGLIDCAASEVLKRNVGDTAWECAVDSGGAEINALVADGVSGIIDDQIVVGDAGGSVAYEALPNGAISYATATNTVSQAVLAGLSDVSGTTGTGSTVVLDASPTIVTPTIASHANAGHDHTAGAGGGNIALGTATTGDYVDGITASQGLLKTGTEGADLGLIDCAATEILKRNAGDTAWECGTDSGGGGDTHPINDSTGIVKDPGDATKILRMDVGANTTGITGVIATAFTTAKTVTIPDATDTLVGKATTDTLTNKTLTLPTIGDFTNATHDHSSSAGGGTSLNGTTLDGTTTLAGNLTRAADQTIDLTGAATRTLTIENSTASQQADVNIDGDLTLSNVNPVITWSDNSIAVPKLKFTGSSTAANNTVEYQFDNLAGGGVGDFRFQIADTATLFNASHLALFFAEGFLFAAGIGNVEFQSAIGGEALFNQAGDDRDFRVETDAAEHMIFAEGGTDRVGINKALPGVTLDVGGDVNVDDTLTFMNGTAFTVEFGVTPTANRTMTLPDANATLVGETLTQTLTNKTISGGLATTTHAAGANFMQTLRHATDCTTITDGKDGEVCYEQDADALFVCEPTAGDCDTAAEWRATGGGGSGDVTDVGDCGGPDCFTATGTGNALTFEGATPDAFESILDAEDPTVGVGTWRLADQAGATTRFVAGDTSKLLELDGDGLTIAGTTLEIDEAFAPTWTNGHVFEEEDVFAAISIEGTTVGGRSPVFQMVTDNGAERTLINLDTLGNLEMRNGTPGADFIFDTNASAGTQDFTVVDGDINLTLSGALVDTIDLSAHTHGGGSGGPAVTGIFADAIGTEELDDTDSPGAGQFVATDGADSSRFEYLQPGTGITIGLDFVTVDLGEEIDNTEIVANTVRGNEIADAYGGAHLTEASNVLDLDLEIRTRTKSWNLFAPATGDSDKIQWAPATAITITKVWCSTDTGTVTLMPDERAEATPNTQGTDVLSAGLVCDNLSQSSCASGCDVNTITNGSIDAYDPVSWDIDAVSTATFVRVHVEFTVND